MARVFAGGTSTDRIATALTTGANLRTYSLWSYRIGAGGGSAGRMLHKGTTGTSFNLNNNEAGTYDYTQVFSGGSGSWTFPRPTALAWHHLAITHDSSSAANDPLVYIDGIPQTVTEVGIPSGTRTDTTEIYSLGNRGSDSARAWDGYLWGFAVWDRILSFSEILGLYNGNPPWRYPDALTSYIPLIDATVTDYVLSAPTVTGTTVVPDPPVRRALHPSHLRPAIFTPGDAR